MPRITSVSNNAVTGNTNAVTLDNVGLILGVTPRISPDGLVVMQIDAEKSELESTTSGIPIYTGPTGQVIFSPIIDATTAQTTVAAMSEQTVVLGGLITNTETKEHHGVPVLDDIPVLNFFFHYDSTVKDKTELLIIMTPHIIRNQAEAEAIKRTEAAKMSWCLSDVTHIYGEAGLRRRSDVWTDGEVPTIYPDAGPLPVGSQPAGPEAIPTPSSQPTGSPQAAPPGQSTPPADKSVAPTSMGTLPTDPSAATGRFPAPQSAPYGDRSLAPTAAVQPANYRSPPWQTGNAAQTAVYQAPAAEAPPPSQPIPSFYYQQQAPASEPEPPAYYPSSQGNPQR